MAGPPIYVTPSGTASVGGTPPRFPLVTRPVAPLSIPRTGGPSVPESRNVRGRTVSSTPTVPVRPPALPVTPTPWWKAIGRKAGLIAAPFLGMDVNKRYRAVIQKINPDSPFYDPELAALLDEDVKKFGASKKGLLGRMGQTALDPVGAASALLQGVVGVGKELLDKPTIDPMGQGVKKDILEEMKEAGAKLRRGRESSFEQRLEGAPRDLTPRGLTQKGDEDYGGLKKKLFLEGMEDTRPMSELKYFYGRAGDPQFADDEKSQVMRIEGLSAERKDRKPRSYEEVQENRLTRGASEPEMYWGEEDRAAYAEMAKNDPDKLRSWFDLDQSGKLDTQERQLIFDPKEGFRARLEKEGVLEAEAAETLQKEERAAASEVAEAVGGLGSWSRKFDRATKGLVGQAEKAKKGVDAKAKAEAEAEAEAAETRLRGRIAFAKGLEGDFGYSDAPSSAFQNPETRVRLMVEAYKRGEELGVDKHRVRSFLREKGILDKGFSESYADFYERNTSSGGGGLRTGSVGGRTTVGRGPKTETGGIRTQQGKFEEEQNRRYHERLLREQSRANLYRPTPISRQFSGDPTYK